MTATTERDTSARLPLSRELVLRAGLVYVDQHGLAALSMHKLGAALGVKAMSLYKYVSGKDDLLDGITEMLWEELPGMPRAGDWRHAVRTAAVSLRDLARRHPNAASLLWESPAYLRRPLLIAHGVLQLMRDDGVPDERAAALLRTIIPYGIGYALAELSLPQPTAPGPGGEIGLIRQITGLLPPEVPDDVVRTAMLLCGDCDMNTQFHMGIDMMIDGLDAYLATSSPSE